ncbi:hypothetical protein QP888_06955 [Corynebacterium sp. MSK297]|uniref:hypothetical protein n=1 Tax=Corynebacterium sp. MSK297 TaxID=3050221 RepID=UPI00254BB7C5|nr:hypothetical protein [Corynebacterium sp. MSK297]MDK8846241.1 hypothetical protein [Corynebacterium sp. MSK297]
MVIHNNSHTVDTMGITGLRGLWKSGDGTPGKYGRCFLGVIKLAGRLILRTNWVD